MPKIDSASLPPLDWSTFAGLRAPQATHVPDELFDWVMAYLTGAELKVVLYIVRRTFGFKKDADAISLNQLCHGIVRRDGRRLDLGTGLKRPTVLEALRSLRAKNLITAVQILDSATGSRPTVYALKLHHGDAPEDSPAAREGGMPGHTPGYASTSADSEEGVCRDIPGGVGPSRPPEYGRADPQHTGRTTHRERQEDRQSTSKASPAVTPRDVHGSDERDSARALDDSMRPPLDAQRRADGTADGLDAPRAGAGHTDARRARGENGAGHPIVVGNVDGESGCAMPVAAPAAVMAEGQGRAQAAARKIAGALPTVAEEERCSPAPHVPPRQDGAATLDRPIPVALSATIARLAKEMGDDAPVRATVTRAYHLMRDAALPVDDFLPLLDQAAVRTRAHRHSVTKRRRGDSAAPRKNLIPYFFAILEDLLACDTRAAHEPDVPPAPATTPLSEAEAVDSAGARAEGRPMWEAALRELRREVTPENYARWFAPTRAVACDGNRLEVAVPDAFHRHWLGERLRGRVEAAFARCGHGVVQVAFVVDSP